MRFGRVNAMVGVGVVISGCGGSGGAVAGVVTTGVGAVGMMGVCLVLPLLFSMMMRSKRDDPPLSLKITSWDSRNLRVRRWTSR